MYILAIDQGTTSSRAIVFDANRQIAATSQQEFPQHYRESGWVEHDPEAIWTSVVRTARDAIAQAALTAADIAAIGITNQRETVVLWDRRTGVPVYNAVVWQDRRTTGLCDLLKQRGLEPVFTAKTGLLLDPYFSGTKIAWLLDNVDGLRARAERGEICFGTIDSFLIWRLTGGRVHVCDATNASRTLLFNIDTQDWDDELLDLLRIPRSILPDVKDCADDFGVTDPSVLGAAISIAGVAGDQQAALIGQGCLSPGMMKSTYGTGCFALVNTGERVQSTSRLLSTVAYRLDGEATYALEGSIFIAGAAVQWLRDGLQLIDSAAKTGALAAEADPHQQVYLVPAFVGLGAPWWEPDARGALFGLTRNSGPAEIARATLQSVAFQTRDLLDAIERDWTAQRVSLLRVDGGMTSSDWTMQALADITGLELIRPKVLESTALGAASLAGYRAGLYPSLGSDGDRDSTRFAPAMDASERERLLKGWRHAVAATIGFAEGLTVA
jgi:glycerol kinase